MNGLGQDILVSGLDQSQCQYLLYLVVMSGFDQEKISKNILNQLISKNQQFSHKVRDFFYQIYRNQTNQLNHQLRGLSRIIKDINLEKQLEKKENESLTNKQKLTILEQLQHKIEKQQYSTCMEAIKIIQNHLILNDQQKRFFVRDSIQKVKFLLRIGQANEPNLREKNDQSLNNQAEETLLQARQHAKKYHSVTDPEQLELATQMCIFYYWNKKQVEKAKKIASQAIENAENDKQFWEGYPMYRKHDPVLDPLNNLKNMLYQWNQNQLA